MLATQVALMSFDRALAVELQLALGNVHVQPYPPDAALQKIQIVIAGGARVTDRLALDQAQAAKRVNEHVAVILIVNQGSEECAVEALRLGVSEYLRAPVAIDDLAQAIRRLQVSEPSAENLLVGASVAMERTRDYIRRVASTDSSVLITGETGTGKELAAQMIHRQSGRAAGPFICVNCAAIPDALLESELFGHERGAFTGAVGVRTGAIEAANKGTILLDEIGEMSPFAQAKLLRVLDTHQIQKLGTTKTSSVNVRMLAATNRELEDLVREKAFRLDLFYRLNVARLRLSPLRDRKEDLPALSNHAILELNRRFGLRIQGLTDEALSALCRHTWPGNVRELKNLLEGIFITQPSSWIGYKDLPEDFRRQIGDPETLGEQEKDRLLEALLSTHWNCKQAAAKLHWSRMTLYRKMAKYRISRKTNA